MSKLMAKLLVIGALCLLLPISVQAQSIKNIILDSASVYSDNNCAVIRVNFNFLIRYEDHFPFESGGDIRIHLSPILNGSEDMALIHTREAVRVRDRDLLPLVNIDYDGITASGPALFMTFNQIVKFKVSQGSDFRSIVVTIYHSDSKSPGAQCQPGTKSVN